jgi:hypothetical protein
MKSPAIAILLLAAAAYISRGVSGLEHGPAN